MGTGRAILLTPPGSAAIAVVRLAGAGVESFLYTHFSRPAVEGRCVHGELTDGTRVIDDPVIVLHTGGAAAEVNVHGGPWVVRSVLELARRAGFEVVERPGLPLADEAVDADTIMGREVLRYLPMARTELAARALLAQEEAWHRFGMPAKTEADVAAIIKDRSLYWLLHPPRVAIIGVPNAGKSTLANQLFAQERSITADLPGTTRDWVGEIANVDGLAVMLVDTPGLRDTDDPIESEAIRRSMGQIERAELVVLVLDVTQPRDPEQRALEAAHRDALVVLNKSDRVAKWGGFSGAVETVATTGRGVDELRAAIRSYFLGSEPFDGDRARWWTERQRLILNRAMTDPSALSDL
jgi:tRNA modification GTPase